MTHVMILVSRFMLLLNTTTLKDKNISTNNAKNNISSNINSTSKMPRPTRSVKPSAQPTIDLSASSSESDNEAKQNPSPAKKAKTPSVVRKGFTSSPAKTTPVKSARQTPSSKTPSPIANRACKTGKPGRSSGAKKAAKASVSNAPSALTPKQLKSWQRKLLQTFTGLQVPRRKAVHQWAELVKYVVGQPGTQSPFTQSVPARKPAQAVQDKDGMTWLRRAIFDQEKERDRQLRSRGLSDKDLRDIAAWHNREVEFLKSLRLILIQGGMIDTDWAKGSAFDRKKACILAGLNDSQKQKLRDTDPINHRQDDKFWR